MASNKKKNRPKTGAATAPKGRPTPPRNRPAAPQRRRAPTSVVIGGIVAVLVGGVVAISILTSSNDTGVTDATAWDLPALSDTGDDDDDGRITLAEFEGKPLVANFLASWCTACESELPRFDAAEALVGDDVSFVFVVSNETGNWRPMAERTGVDDQILVRDINGNGGNGLYFDLGGTGGMPMTAFYDADGEVVHVDRGELSSEMLAERLATLFGVTFAS